jgi:hypothetical protein
MGQRENSYKILFVITEITEAKKIDRRDGHRWK